MVPIRISVSPHHFADLARELRQGKRLGEYFHAGVENDVANCGIPRVRRPHPIAYMAREGRFGIDDVLRSLQHLALGGVARPQRGR